MESPSRTSTEAAIETCLDVSARGIETSPSGFPGALEPLIDPETRSRRWTILASAILTAIAYYVAMHCYWTPAHGGTDQNGYLVGGKMIVDHLSTGQFPPDIFSFVGHMWIGTKWDVFYPKYPIGLPIIYAIVSVLGRADRVNWAYEVSPVAMSLALVATFLVLRIVIGSFPALLGMLAVACSPVTLELTNNPNSHASSLAFVAWGMFFLLRWWQSRGIWRAAAAGLLIGYAATIRYTEGLLVLPVLYVALMNTRWRGQRARVGQSLLESAMLLAWWAIPILGLVCFNLAAFGDITGYDSTNESTGFSWDNFQRNWEPMLRQMYQSGLFFILPLAVQGMFLMFFRRWRVALLLALWTIPSVLVYTAYYWAPDNQQLAFVNIGYLRFFLTVLPALACCAYWLLGEMMPTRRPGDGVRAMNGAINRAAEQDGDDAMSDGSRVGIGGRGAGRLGGAAGNHFGGIGAVLAAGLLTLACCGVSADTTVLSLETEQRNQAFIAQSADIVSRDARPDGIATKDDLRKPGGIPAGSVIFCSNDNLMDHLQFVGDWRMYDTRIFQEQFIEEATRLDPTRPNPLQFERAQMLYKMLHELNQAQLAQEEHKLVTRSLAQGRRVFVILPRAQFLAMRMRFFPAYLFRSRLIAQWPEQPEARPPPRWRMAQTPDPPNAPPPPAPPLWELLELTNVPGAIMRTPTERPRRFWQ